MARWHWANLRGEAVFDAVSALAEGEALMIRADRGVDAGKIAALLPRLAAQGVRRVKTCLGDAIAMRTYFEGSLFLGLALTAHLAVWPSAPETGVEGAGEGGDDLLSVQASNASIATLVETWDSPPELTTEPESAAAGNRAMFGDDGARDADDVRKPGRPLAPFSRRNR